MTWLPGLALALLGLALFGAGLAAYGALHWTGSTKTLLHKLEAGRTAAQLLVPPYIRPAVSPYPQVPPGLPVPTRYDARELDSLPAPVQRYFRAVLTDGQPIITAASLDMTGRFNLSATGEQWKPFTSHQRITTRRPGFLWDATITMVLGVKVRVVDSYIAGHGLLHAAVLGLFTMAEQHGDGEIARGEFMRWFAEVPWVPTALLPSQGVRWEAVEDHSANATVQDGPLSLTLLFRFNHDGLIGSVRAEARGSLVKGQMVMAPWEGIWSNYQRCDGVLVPLTGEVAWMRPEGRRPYFVGTVTALRYELAR